METKNPKKTNGTFNEAGRTRELLNNASSVMIDLYKKQLDTTFGFYNNIFNSAMGVGRNSWGIDLNANPFLPSSNSFKSLFSPFSWFKSDGEHTDRITPVYENFFKQISEFNKNWLGAFQETYHFGQNDLAALNEKYQKLLEDRRNAMKAIMDNLIETYNKQLDFSAQLNKKMLSELDIQMNKALKANMEFWASVVKQYGKTSKGEEEKSHKTVKKETHQQAEGNLN